MTTTPHPVDVLARELPVLGVGASLSFGVEPNPVALAQAAGGPDFIEYAGAVDPALVQQPVEQLRKLGVPVLYHPSCLNLCGPWANPAEWVDAVDRHVATVGSAWLAQDVSVCFVGDTPGYSIQLGYFIPPERTEAGLAEAVKRVREVRDRVGAPLLLEPAPASFRWGPIPMLEWLDRLCEATGCGMLLDAGHVLSHAVLETDAMNRPDPLAGVNMERVFEVHVAGGILHESDAGTFYQDAHELPIQPEVWAVFLRLLRACPNLKAVCVECEGAAAHTVLPVLERVRQAVAIHAVSTGLRAHVRAGASVALPEPVQPPAYPVPALPPAGPTAFPGLVQLLFDAEARARLPASAEALAVELNVPLELLDGVDPRGLALDAEGRRTYLMSALCRAFPLSSALIGARPGGPTRLAAFLMSPALFGPLGPRTEAFGLHLERIATLMPDDENSVQQAILAVVAYERALAANAAAVRAAVERGGAVPAPRAPSRSEKRHGTMALPPHTIVVELPQPLAALQAALDGLTAADAWLRIARGAVEDARVRAVLRSEPSPVTVLARAHSAGRIVERGASGGAAPLVDVTQRTAELRGRKGRWLTSLMGERLVSLAPAHQRLAEGLLQAGVLDVGTQRRDGPTSR